ncbi:serine hydrolase domain-containing protein [Occallatibacter riparius]|uniref:Beta-lactamase family protein n=1 Tax=Occallatibacter riparius TaxID=1002689 RepID=A0A9J7BHW8_9BACT|nr:serine hydrolase domain-containing protein [Occallatibacter riparius]UWZ82392.1 beta-lactamase family protein [Occallatibacter riparius]
MMMRKIGFVALLLSGLASHAPAQGSGRDAVSMQTVKPETVGFSTERLENLHKIIQAEVDEKHLAGAVTILARHGKIVEYRTYGVKDLAINAPMTKDTIFRDYSMTKPITGVSMMILFEQGKWLPADPISKYVPEFANLKVFNGVDGDGKPILVDPEHAPTMRELMSHSAGFLYGFGNSKMDDLYKEAKPLAAANLQEMIDRLAKLPLAYQPGKGWQYSMSMDVQGYVIEKYSGQSLPQFMHDHIFAPLGMKDAGFYVPADKRSRFASNYRDDKGKLVPTQEAAGPPTDYSEEPKLASGGGGLVSTAEDYYRFAQMLANGGELNGVRVLSPASVKLMMSNHLPKELMTGQFGIGMHVMRPGFGYGYDGAVVFDPAEANLPDGAGTYFWDGAAGTWFWVDPTNDVVFVGMIQRMGGGDNHPLAYRTHSAVYSALVDPRK